jgi:hypothetical protein
LATRGDDLFRLEDDKLVTQAYGSSANLVGQFISLGGRYPDAISGVALVGTLATSARGDYYQYSTVDVYGPITGLVTAENELPGATWLQGSRLVYQNREFKALLAGKNLALPKLALSNERDCESEFRLKTFAAGLNGAVVAVGPRCGAEEQLMAERWEGGKSDGHVSALQSQAMVPKSATLTVVLGPGRLGAVIASDADTATTWRETKAGFQELLTPVFPDPYSLAVGVEGELWLVARPRGKELNHARAFFFSGARWSELELPNDAALKAKLGTPEAPETLWLRPNNFVVRGEKVYLAASIYQGNDRMLGSAILSPRRPSAEPEAPTTEAAEPADLGCVPQVVLFAVSKSTPADYQYPATHDAIIGTHFAESAEFVEVLRSGQRTLVAKTKTRKEADALAAHIKERVAGSRPAVVCEPAPEALRQLSMH